MNTLRKSRLSAPVVMILVTGFVVVSILHLLLTILTSQSVYELADLKREKRKLDTTSQILSEEVSSLASNQNLLNAASRLGMVANTNPVFLRLTDQAVLGQPLPAPIASAQSTNLVANSAMIIQSTQIDQVSVPASTTEPTAIPTEPVVSTSLIPASPTR
jgi:Na+-transporting NADH:ubiquinone oxidoreductase subunit NqrC